MTEFVSELIYTHAPLVTPAVEAPTLKTRLQPRSGWIGIGYEGAYIGIHRHDVKITDLQNTQLLTLATLRWWQPQMLAWLDKLETNYNLEALSIVRLIGGTISIVRTQTRRRRQTLAIDTVTDTELFKDLDRFLQSRDLYRQHPIPVKHIPDFSKKSGIFLIRSNVIVPKTIDSTSTESILI